MKPGQSFVSGGGWDETDVASQVIKGKGYNAALVGRISRVEDQGEEEHVVIRVAITTKT